MLRTDEMAANAPLYSWCSNASARWSGLSAFSARALADGVVIRHGEHLWASPALSRLAELKLIAA
jgi:hypothetical protein